MTKSTKVVNAALNHAYDKFQYHRLFWNKTDSQKMENLDRFEMRGKAEHTEYIQEVSDFLVTICILVIRPTQGRYINIHSK